MGADRLFQFKAITAPPDTSGGVEDVTLDKWFSLAIVPRFPSKTFFVDSGTTTPAADGTGLDLDAWPTLTNPVTVPRRPTPTMPADPSFVVAEGAVDVPIDLWEAPAFLFRSRPRWSDPAPRTTVPVLAIVPMRRYTFVGADRSIVTLSTARRTQMPDSLIQDYAPPLKWPAAQLQTVRVTPTLPSGRAMGDWDTFLLTVREDPEFPRTGEKLADIVLADPLADGWAVSTSATGTVSGSTVSFSVTVPTGPGFRRYSIDVVASGGTAGRVQLFAATFLTVLPTLKAVA